MKRSAIVLVALLLCLQHVGCGSGEPATEPTSAAPAAPVLAAPAPAVPPAVLPVVPAPPSVPPIGAAPVAAVVPVAPAGPTLGMGDVLPFAATPPATGPAVEPVTGIEWDAVRALLAACVPISRGTRSGYRALDGAGAVSREEVVPRAFRSGGARLAHAPAWWRPAPGTTLLVAPYRLLGGHGGLGLAFFEPASGGVRYVRHLEEAEETGAGGCSPVVNEIAVPEDGSEWRRLVTCDAGGEVLTVSFREGAIRVRAQYVGGDGALDREMREVAAGGAAAAPPAGGGGAPAADVDLLLAGLCCTVTDTRCPGPFASAVAACDALARAPACDRCARTWGADGYEGDDPLVSLRETCASRCP